MTNPPKPRDRDREFIEEFLQRNRACANNPTVETILGTVRKGEYTYPQAMCGMIAALCNQNSDLTRALEKARAQRA